MVFTGAYHGWLSYAYRSIALACASGGIMTIEVKVAEHYTRDRLTEKILNALESTGKRRDSLTARDLEALDNLHVGGRESIEALAAFMDLKPGMRLLDVGCGVGGPARYFAERGCVVTGIDLTEEFVRTAKELTKLLKLSEAAQFQQGSALELPFESRAFDACYMVHVGMNIKDKPLLFREVGRAIRPGGRFAIFDIMRVSSADLPFPLPWALTPATSFVATVDEYRGALEAAGFQVVHERGRRQFAIESMERMRAQAASGSPQTLGVHILMGEQAPLMLKNVNQAIAAGTLEPIELVGLMP